VWDRWRGGTEIVHGSTLRLSDSEDGFFYFGSTFRHLWNLTDGFFDDVTFNMWREEKWRPIIEYLLNSAEMFVFSFPSLDPEINPYKLSDYEINLLSEYGIFPELENNTITISPEELQELRQNLLALITQKKMSAEDYIEHAMQHELR